MDMGLNAWFRPKTPYSVGDSDGFRLGRLGRLPGGGEGGGNSVR